MPSVYEKYQLKPVINASGRMTLLGVSTPEQEVVDAVNFGLGHYFEVKDLIDKTGAYIAGLLGAEDAVVVSCASAGIAQSVAAVIVRGDPYRLEHLHAHAHGVPSEIVLPKGHNVNFGAPVGTMVNLGGGKVVEAGYANECSAAQLAAAINANTAAILYIKSHHCVQKSILSDTEVILEDRVFGKPADAADAAEMLRALSGRTHEVLTAVSLVSAGREAQAAVLTRVSVEALPEADIQRYLTSGEWQGKAGAYAIQGRFEAHVQRLDGSYSGVMGLPLHETAGLLRQFGLLP